VISRVYSVDHGDGSSILPYKGFNKNFDEEVPYIALVKDEGNIEAWALDDSAHAAGELVRYYEDTNSHGNWQLLGVFVNLRNLR
jgi:hypothetical protein